MATNWLANVRSSTCPYTRMEIRELAQRRLLFRFRPTNSQRYIVPDFQMRDHGVSPWVGPLLGSLAWIEDRGPDRDKDGMRRAHWLYRKRDYLSETSLAVIGHWPPGWDPDGRNLDHFLDVFGMKLERKSRSFAEIFDQHPRLVIDYQYRLQGVRWDAFEYQM